MNLNLSQQGLSKAFYTTIGIVEDTNDPAQMGRVRVYCPSIDHEDHIIDDLPWALYSTPFGGAVKNFAAGPDGDITYGQTSYGMWAIPKVGATVLIQFINGDTNYRVWTGCIYPIQSQRGMPAGRGLDITKEKPFPYGPFSDSYEDVQPARKNLEAAGLHDKHYFTRGGYERQAAMAITDKDGSEGYSKNPNRTSPSELDPQGYHLVTPGHHYITMQDAADYCRIRIKTTTGHQIILDDTNDRIYVSTNRGKSWFEMDSDGHIHFYGSDAVSFTTDTDFNVTAVGNINMNAGGAINMKAGDSINGTAGGDINLKSGCSTLITCGDNFEMNAATLGNLTSGSTMNIKAGGNIVASGTQIHLNSQAAATAAKATESKTPGIVPEKEPWARPKSDEVRNKFWKP